MDVIARGLGIAIAKRDAMGSLATLVALGSGLALGLATIPHCVAMCGALAAVASASPTTHGSAQWQLGRGLAYALLGALAGTAGEGVHAVLPAAWASALTSGALAIGLGLAGWRLLRAPARPAAPLIAPDALLRPRDRHASIDRRASTETIEPTPARGGWLRALARTPLLLGMLTGVLPCGALASAVLVAAGTGTALTGAAAMLGFALASGSGLWIVSAVARRATLDETSRRALAIGLLAGALVLVARPLASWRAGDDASTGRCHAPATALATHD